MRGGGMGGGCGCEGSVRGWEEAVGVRGGGMGGGCGCEGMGDGRRLWV